MAALALATVALLALGGDDVRIRWKEKELKLAELPADLPESARSAIELWSPWAREARFRLDLDPTARVLLVTHVESSQTDKQLELTSAVVARFDQDLPAPAVRKTAAPLPLVAEAPPPADAWSREALDVQPEMDLLKRRTPVTTGYTPATTAWTPLPGEIEAGQAPSPGALLDRKSVV